MKQIVTRFAPSPTGNLHIGGLRTALYAYAYARQNQGTVFLRIEDTDQKRKVEGAAEKIPGLLSEFGLSWDAIYTQSERAEAGVYASIAKQLVNDGKAFYCQCEGRNAKKEGYSTELRDPCRDKGLTSGAIKLRTPDDEIVTYYDFVFKKEISWNTSGVRDAVLLKSDGIFPTYHLAVAVDDHEMEVSHIFRGYDWLPSTPIHLLVFKYLGYELPALGHLTDIQDPEGGKLSKRKGSTSCQGLLDDGYLPEALLNFIALCGWAPKDNREMFLLSDFVDAFTLDGIQKANPVFNRDKLNWFNREYIKLLSVDEQKSYIKKFLPERFSEISDEVLSKLVPIIIERIHYFGEVSELAQQGEYDYFISQPVIDLEKLVWKTDTLDQAKIHLQQVITLLQDYDDVWTSDTIKSMLWGYAESVGRGSVLWPMRFALSGREKSPDPFTLAEIFGKTETLKRIDNVIKKL